MVTAWHHGVRNCQKPEGGTTDQDLRTRTAYDESLATVI